MPEIFSSFPGKAASEQSNAGTTHSRGDRANLSGYTAILIREPFEDFWLILLPAVTEILLKMRLSTFQEIGHHLSPAFDMNQTAFF